MQWWKYTSSTKIWAKVGSQNCRKEISENERLVVLDEDEAKFLHIKQLDWFDLEDYYEDLCDRREELASLTAKGQEATQDLHDTYHKLAFIEEEMKIRIG